MRCWAGLVTVIGERDVDRQHAAPCPARGRPTPPRHPVRGATHPRHPVRGHATPPRHPVRYMTPSAIIPRAAMGGEAIPQTGPFCVLWLRDLRCTDAQGAPSGERVGLRNTEHTLPATCPPFTRIKRLLAGETKGMARGSPWVATNVTEDAVAARLYRCPPLPAAGPGPTPAATKCRFLLVALRWHSELAPPAVALPVTFTLTVIDYAVRVKKSGYMFRVGVFLDFVRRSGTTRAEVPHGGASHVRRAKRSRIDRRARIILPRLRARPGPGPGPAITITITARGDGRGA